MLASWPQRTAPVWFATTLQKLLLFESSPHARWFRTPRHAGPPRPECGLRHRFSHHQPISKCSNHPFLLASGGPQGQCLVPYCSSALFGKHITHCYADDTQLYLCISSIPNAVVSPSPESKRPDVNSVSSIKSLSSSSLIPSTSTHPLSPAHTASWGLRTFSRHTFSNWNSLLNLVYLLLHFCNQPAGGFKPHS